MATVRRPAGLRPSATPPQRALHGSQRGARGMRLGAEGHEHPQRPVCGSAGHALSSRAVHGRDASWEAQPPPASCEHCALETRLGGLEN